MAEIIGANAVDAWRNCVRHLLEQGSDELNLLVTINDPTILVPAWLSDFNPRKLHPAKDNLADVISTVFPYKLAAKCKTRNELYQKYLARHQRARKFIRNRGTWGTYFERLVHMGNPPTNQLERAISKLNSWQVRAATALVFHPSTPALDSPRKRGGPCWHFGELIWHRNDVLDLVVVYRNHDYFNKALGNFISHGQLLNFICTQTKKTPGRVICHSIHAFYAEADVSMAALAKI